MLSDELPQVILGGGVFNTQMNDDPLALPIPQIIRKAFDAGINAIDTSPYYGPSEELIGKALQDPLIVNKYSRDDYIVITKCGRINLDTFDYSKAHVQESVTRSMRRFNTSYLDVVFCHDVEFVSEDEVVEAFSELCKLQEQGKVRYVGISSYHPQVVSRIIPKLKSECGKTPDVVQNYAHFTIQNTTLDQHSQSWLDQGVNCVLNSSPLNMGLLSGKPAAPFHPASQGLRDAAMNAARHCEQKEEMSLPEVSLRYVIGKYNEQRESNGGGFIINGISFVEELNALLAVVADIFEPASKPVTNNMKLNQKRLQELEPIFDRVRQQFGNYINVEWQSPPPDFVRKAP
jgi:D-arabinose 1-dehydrogenase